MADLQYTLTLSELEYSTIMRLVMKFGTGAVTDGISTSVELRQKLATPRIETAK